MNITRFVRFVAVIFRNGKFHASGVDYPKLRRAALAGLEQFSPLPAKRPAGRGWIMTNPLLRFWAGQAAFLKNAVRSRGSDLCLENSGLCYVRIPKAASTALSYAILMGRFPDLRSHTLTPQKINFLTDVNLRKIYDDGGTKRTFFSVVRNPFSRIVSLYRDAFERASGEFIYEDYLFGIFRKEMAFKDFVKTVYLIPDSLKDQHLKPQYALLEFYRRRKIPVSIFKLEESAPIRNFLSRFGLRLAPVNQSTGTYDYRNYYDEETLEMVYRIYRRDVALYGYANEYERLREFVSRGGPTFGKLQKLENL